MAVPVLLYGCTTVGLLVGRVCGQGAGGGATMATRREQWKRRRYRRAMWAKLELGMTADAAVAWAASAAAGGSSQKKLKDKTKVKKDIARK